ncbi:MAG: dihydroorotase [Desulfobacterales bacterium]|nr:dihydroorotase [Desulfobacterales bacterium]
MRILIKGGKIVDPAVSEAEADLLVVDGVIREIRPVGAGGEQAACDRVIDAAGKLVMPGLIDMHVHLREPGFEYKETIESGCAAAAAGGFTAVCCMPNTDPVNDCPELTEFILKKAQAAGTARVHPVAAISRLSEGKRLCEYGELKAAGVVAVSDDGRPVESGRLMRRAMEYASGFGLPVISHCEELSLAGDGVMNEGAYATKMGLPGIPNTAESVMVLRDIALSELTGCPLHIAHVSTKESVAAIREAKKRGVPVTAETAPHYFTLTEEAVGQYDTHAKMNPPLRSAGDLEAIVEGLADGTIDVIATDHAPHAPVEKEVEFDHAPNGIIGLETSVGLTLRLVRKGVLTLGQMVEKMSLNPARILGLTRGVSEGLPADLTLIDPEQEWTVEAAAFRSLSRNTPFIGWTLPGKAVLTMVGGRIIHG